MKESTIQNLPIVEPDLVELYRVSKAKRDIWLKRGNECKAFYRNNCEGTFTTFTKDQLKVIENDLSNLPISTNFLHPTIQQRTALLSKNKYSTKIVSLDGRTYDYAQVLDKAKQGILYQSHFNTSMKQAIKDIHIYGHGYLLSEEADRFYKGQFGINTKHLPCDQVILDCNMRSPLGDDAEVFFIEKEITETALWKTYRPLFESLGFENVLEVRALAGDTWSSVMGSGIVDAGIKQKYVLRWAYDRVATDMYLVDTNDGIEQMFMENLDEESKILITSNTPKVPDLYVRKRLFVGNYEIFSSVMPLTILPLTMFWYDWDDEPYESYGLAHWLLGLQQANDKVLQLMITNGMLTNNAGYLIPKGSVTPEDKPKWESSGNKPGVLKEFTIKNIDGQVVVPKREEVAGLSNFFPTVYETTYNGLKEVSGITPVIAGDTRGSNVEVFASLQTYQNAAMQRISMNSDDINAAMEVLGQVLVEYLIWKIKKSTYVYFDPENEEVNEIQIADDINNFKISKYMVVATPSTMSQTQKLSYADTLAKIAQSSPDAVTRNILTVESMKLAEMPKAKSILQDIDVAKNLERQVNGLQEALDRERELTKQMENKLINVEIENKILQKAQTGLIKIAETFGSVQESLSEQIEQQTKS